MIRTRMAAGRLLAACGLALALCVASLTGALAQALPSTLPTGTVVDVSPVIGEMVNLAIVICGPAIGAALFGGVLQLCRFAGVKITDAKERSIRDTVDQALFHSANFARTRAGELGPMAIDLRTADLAAGAEYAMKSIPGTLKKLGITDAASERLKDMVAARLPTVVQTS